MEPSRVLLQLLRHLWVQPSLARQMMIWALLLYLMS